MAEKKNIQKRTGGRKRTSARRSLSRHKRSEMPRWLLVLLVVTLSVAALYFTYLFFFRPYFYRFRPCYGQKHYKICLPLNYEIFGIDISRHQGYINWEKVKRGRPEEAPVSFIYMKATEGSDFVDVNFVENFENARKHGFIRGAYHYFGTRSNGMAQAEMFIKTVKLEKGDLPPVVDVEEKAKDMNRYMQELKIFIARIEEHYGVKPVIYTYKKYKEKYLKDKFFDKYPAWIAHYYVSELETDARWIMWQCSDIGSISGISQNVDINVFNGSMEQLDSIRIK